MKKILAFLFSMAIGLTGPAWASMPQGFEMKTLRSHTQPLADASTVTVTVNIKYDSSLAPRHVEALSRGGKCVLENAYYGDKQVQLKLTPGEYDFHLVLAPYDKRYPVTNQVNFYEPYHHVFAEKVKVEGDMTLELDAATATNYVHFEAVTPDGEKFKHIVVRGSQLDYTDANIFYETLSLQIWNKDNGEVECLYSTSSHETEEGRSSVNAFDYYVNDVSDRYVFTQSRLAVSPDNELYALMMGVTGSQKGITNVSNTAADYVFRKEAFQVSPSYDGFPHELYRSGVDVYAKINNLETRKFQHRSADPDPSAYFCWIGPDADLDYNFHLRPMIFELDAVEGDDESKRNQYVTAGCPINMTPSGAQYENASNGYFKWDEIGGVMGDNVPLTMLVMHQTNVDGNAVVKYAPTFVGRYGETRQSDVATLEVEVCHDGEPVCTSWQELNTWAESWAADGHTPGVMTARFTNTNCRFEGVEGRSVLEVTYKEGRNDMCAPTSQMLVFSDADGLVKNVFGPSEGAINIELAAGDPRGNGKRYSYMDAYEVKVEYAPHGTQDFKALNTKVVKNATSSTAWTVYAGAIPSAAALGEGMYDVRIHLADNEGNTSVQTISPAFKIGEAAAIDHVVSDRHMRSVACCGTTVTLTGFDAPHSRVFAVGGQLVMEADGDSFDVSSLVSGIYFVAVDGQVYKIIKR